EKLELVPRLSLNNKGQLAEGHEPDANQPPRAQFQDFSGNFGVQAVFERRGWRLRSQSNAIGASRQEEALRFGQMGADAPRIDLSDYLLTLERGPVVLRLGDVAYGAHRHLLSGLQHRGVATDVRLARFARVSLAGLSGSTVVGWSNLLGVTRAQHRIVSGNIALDLVPRHPGMVQLDGGWVDGSVLPQAGFAQGAVNDAEESRGSAIRFGLQDPSQRIRLDAGYARSRFVNPADALLAQGADLVPVQPETRDARYLNLNLELLRAVPFAHSLPLSATVAVHHERVAPLYRTVAMPGIRADNLQNTFELRASAGAASLQLSHTRSSDNLDGIPTILSTRLRASQANVSLPLASLLGASAPTWLPMLTGGLGRVHQFGLGVPAGSETPETFVPDQVSTNGTLSAQVQGSFWQLLLQLNRSTQDNRQTGRESADFVNHTRGISLGVTPGRAFVLSLDLAQDVARSEERGEETTTNRINGSIVWTAATTGAQAGVAAARVTDNPRTFRQNTFDVRVEVSQTVPVFGARAGRQPAQLFLRYANQLSLHALRGGERSTVRSWTLATGLSLSLF
ncbi:MAG: hypothetical protein L0271_22325, partial [Gemmatimonadetes bacterium]|nr:hypothetical protein [Gemmatimonadota bacterium]